MMEEKETRKRNPPIKVWCLHSERAAIEANAKAAGLSLSTYLRRVGMGYEIMAFSIMTQSSSCRESMPTWAD